MNERAFVCQKMCESVEQIFQEKMSPIDEELKVKLLETWSYYKAIAMKELDADAGLSFMQANRLKQLKEKEKPF